MTDAFQEHHLIRRLCTKINLATSIPHDRTANSIFKQKIPTLFVAYEKAFAGSEKYEFDHISSTLYVYPL
jgi:hypothetical protein